MTGPLDANPDMVALDGRGLDTRDVLLRLKDILSSRCGEIVMEITLGRGQDLKQVKAYLAMSGCITKVEDRGDVYVVHAKGGCSSCR